MTATADPPPATAADGPPRPAPRGWPADFPHPADLTERDALDLGELPE